MPKIEMGKTYKTRDGRDVRILCTDLAAQYPVVGIVGGCIVQTYSPDGRYHTLDKESPFDLVEVKELSRNG